MRSPLVVVAPPALEHALGMVKGPEEHLVQQLVAKAAVRALVKAVLLGFAGRYVVPADAGVVRPLQDGVRGVPNPVVADDGLWPPAPSDDLVEFAGDAAQQPKMSSPPSGRRPRPRPSPLSSESARPASRFQSTCRASASWFLHQHNAPAVGAIAYASFQRPQPRPSRP